jgi:hypothetical protein
LILFLLFHGVPLVLLITLAVMLYLSAMELRKRPWRRLVKLWWLLLVFLTSAFGFLALLAYLQLRKEET